MARLLASRPARGIAFVLTVAAFGSFAGVASGAVLPDERSYELISPGDNADVEVDVLPFIRPSGDGQKVAYQVLGDVRTGRASKLGTYIASRGQEGWTSEKLTPPSGNESHPNPNYYLYGNIFYRFTDDLSKAIYVGQSTSPLVPGEPADKANAYVRDNTTGRYELITDRAPEPLPYPNWKHAPPRVVWSSDDLETVVFDSEGYGQGWADPVYFPGSSAQSVYAWNKRDGMSIASVLPDGRFAASAYAGSGAQVNMGGGNQSFGDLYGGDRNAVSADGTRIFFSAGSNLYLRKNHGTPQAETVRVDRPEAGMPTQNGGGRFLAASPDGHRVLFASCAKLTADSTATGSGQLCSPFSFNNNGTVLTANRPSLYLWDEDANGGAGELTDLTTQDPGGAGVAGALGVNSDLTRVYFAATGTLASGIPPAPAGAVERPTDPKLYVWDADDGIKFIARMRNPSNWYFNIRGDRSTWEGPMDTPTRDATVSEDADKLAWGTYWPVDPSHNNIDPQTQDPHKQVYVYDYDSDDVRCVSCRPTGAARSDASVTSQRLNTGESGVQSYPDYRRRNLVAGGTQLYYETADPLLSDDTNLVNDVYQYRTDTHERTLISSGRSGSNSHYAGATEDGRSVFLRTREGLVNADRNSNTDLYVARSNSTVRDDPPPPLACPGGCPIVPGSFAYSGPTDPAPPSFLEVTAVSASQRSAAAKSGRFKLRVTVPSGGTVRARAVAAFGRKLRKEVGRATVRAKAKGRITITLALSRKARKELSRKRRLPLRVEVAFGNQKRTTRLTLIKPKPKKKTKKSTTRTGR